MRVPIAVVQSLVVSPHPKDFHHLLLLEHLVHKTVLDVDPARVGSGEIPEELLASRRRAKGIPFKYLEQTQRAFLQTGAGELLCVALRVLGVDEVVTHQLSSASQRLTGVFSPLRIESAIPGTDRR